MASINKKTISTNLLSLYCLLCMPVTVLAQTQLGADIDGEAADDHSGYGVSLSADGYRMAIGALRNDGKGTDSGHVRVFRWSNATWEQLGTDIDGEAADDQHGRSVSLSSDGSRLAVGASLNDGNGLDSGHVRVYQWSGSAWVQLGTDIDGEAAEDGSGYSVSLSSDGSRLAIGAHSNDGNGDSSGHVRVYQWSGSTWEQLGTDIDGEATGDGSGLAVSLSSEGNRLAIGAAGNDGNGNSSGHVRVYQWSGSAWTQLGADIDGEATGDSSGLAVSLSSEGNRVAIGASSNDSKGNATGHVRVYQWSGSTWVQLGLDIDGETADDRSGYTVSLSSNGNRLAIGALGNDGNGDGAGHARVYQWSGSKWAQLGNDIDGEAARDGFSRVSLSSDGNRLAIGGSRNDGGGEDSGHVRVYALNISNVFQINAGLNDAWYSPATDGQGFFITVFPDVGVVVLAWFTYDTELPPEDATANLGDAGHRWLLAVGPFLNKEAILDIEVASGGIFDTASEITRVLDGTIILSFEDCNTGTVEYNIPSIDRQGIVPIQRVAKDNIVLCEALNEELNNIQ